MHAKASKYEESDEDVVAEGDSDNNSSSVEAFLLDDNENSS